MNKAPLKHPLTAFIEKKFEDVANFNVQYASQSPKWEYERFPATISNAVLVEFGGLPVCPVLSALKPEEYFNFLLECVEEKQKLFYTIGTPVEDGMVERFDVMTDESILYALSSVLPKVHTYGYCYTVEGFERPYAMFNGRYDVILLTADQYEKHKNGFDIE